MAVADNALLMNRNGESLWGEISDVLTEENISRAFDVRVIVSEVQYKGRRIRSILPAEIISGESASGGIKFEETEAVS